MSLKPRRLSLGLTGGIGSGKSTVAAMLVGHGAVLVDTDAIARSITGPSGCAMAEIKQAFGSSVIDRYGALDRAGMRELAFGDPIARRKLESILHPLIGAEALLQADQASSDVVVFDVPLLAESSHWRARCTRILVIDCCVETQVGRVITRSGWAPSQVHSVIGQQMSRLRRRAIADATLYNDGLSLEQLALQVEALWRHWCRSSSAL